MMEMECPNSDDNATVDQTMFCPNCEGLLYPTDGDFKFFMFTCRACGHEEHLDYDFSWEKHKVNGICILPRVKVASGGTCVPNAIITSIETRLKFLNAKKSISSEDLSVDDLIKQYADKMGPKFLWEDGSEGYNRIKICKEICELNGILTANAYRSNEKEGIRYKAKAHRRKNSSFLNSCKSILKGNALFTTIPITEQFKTLKGQEMYIADEAEVIRSRVGMQDRIFHAIILVGFGQRKKVNYFRFMNSYGVKFGNKGFADVRAAEVKDVTRFVCSSSCPKDSMDLPRALFRDNEKKKPEYLE